LVYIGYKLIGDSEYFDKIRERELQKTLLKKHIENDIQESFILFDAYLRHSYATTSIPNDHLEILQQINQEFDGKAKQALTDRFLDNSIRLGKVNRNIEFFIRIFNA
jgi:transposase